MNVTVVGAGHVGLVTAVTLAHLGNKVLVVDTDSSRVQTLQGGQVPFFEPGLQAMLSEVNEAGCVAFTADFASALHESEIVFLCVGTPATASGEANLRAVEDSARSVARSARGHIVVAEKSTVPAGTAGWLRALLEREGPQATYDVVSNPEFLREGSAVSDALHPPRILVGADSERGRDAMRTLYGPLIAAGTPVIEMDIATAELAKHATNAFLALKISFINGVARVCERLGADVVDIADLMGADPRIGREFLNAGLGFGGSCFHKDLLAFHSLSAQAGYDFPLLLEVLRLNEEAVSAFMTTIEETVVSVRGKRVALLGLAFKPNTDDIRFSPALRLASLLLDAGADVVGYDPHANANARAALDGLRTTEDPYAACQGAQCFVLCTEWEEFRTLDPGRLADAMDELVAIDGRNFLDEDALVGAGFSYRGPGGGSQSRTRFP